MRRLAGSLWAVAVLFVPMGVAENRASAASITFTETITASGYLGTTQFSDALVTIMAVADTDNVTTVPGHSGVLAVPDSSATITVAGVGSATFTGPTLNFVNTGADIVGINSGTIAQLGTDILDVKSPTFDTYNLTTSIGPMSGTSSGGGGPYATTSGNLILDPFGSSTATFQSLLQSTSIPEPSTLVCAASAVLWGLAYACRRRLASA